MIRRTAVLACTLLLMAGCNGTSSEDTFGDECRPAAEGTLVFGKVTDGARSPLAGANVTARGLGGHQHQVSVETDGRGCYALELPAAQFHDLTASKPGYASHTEKSVAVANGERHKVNFELQAS